MPRATFGTPATRTAQSATSIRRPGKSQFSRCPTRMRRTRIRWCSTEGHRCGSRLQNSNMVGRLDPESGDIKLVTLSRAELQALRHQDRRRGQSLVLVQRSAVSLQDQPGELWTDRNQAAARRHDGAPPRYRRGRHDLVRQLGHGRLGRYNPKTGDIKEWPSPSGPKSHPYAIVVVDGIVWYNESGMRPDPLVRFDPRPRRSRVGRSRRAISTLASSGTCGPTKDGSLLIHQSSTNRIMQVTVQRRAASR